MKRQIRDRIIVFVVLDKNATKSLRKEIDTTFVIRAELDEVMLVELSLRRIGDLATMKGVVEVCEDEIPQNLLSTLSLEATRMATIWNWRLQTKRSIVPISDANVDKLMKQLDLEVVKGVVIDKRTKKSLGKVEDVEFTHQHRHYSPNPGCYWLRGTNSWRVVPGLFGAWTRVRGTSETRQCTSGGGMSSNRQTVDYIRVTVWNQVDAYARKSQNNASYVLASDWEYCWLWEVEVGGAYTNSDHYSNWGGSTIYLSI